MKTFGLITNRAGFKYWYWLCTKENATGIYINLVKQHGDIWINAGGGWTIKKDIKRIHRTVQSENFPLYKKKML